MYLLFITVIERLKNCYPHIATYLQDGKYRLSLLHKVSLRHRLTTDQLLDDVAKILCAVDLDDIFHLADMLLYVGNSSSIFLLL